VICHHTTVLVDYDHPHGTLVVRLAELVASDPRTTRDLMVVRRPRCADCGKALSPEALEVTDSRIPFE
jgi:hypothetical protein